MVKPGGFMESADFTVIFYLMILLGVASALIHFMTFSRLRAQALLKNHLDEKK